MTDLIVHWRPGHASSSGRGSFFLGDGHVDAVRTPIAESWFRSHTAGVDPSGGHLAPVLADADETSARWDAHPLAAAVPLIEDSLAAVADESAHLIVVR